MEKLLLQIKKLKQLSRKQIILGVGGLLIVGGAVYSFTRSPVLTVVQAQKGSIEEEVLVTGKTKSSQEVNLGFEKSGKVVSAPREVGERVVVGETLVVLDQSSLLADLRKAQANLNEELVRFDSTKHSTSLEYNDAHDALFNAIEDSYSAADNAIRNTADRFFDNPTTPSAKFNIVFTDGNTTYHFEIAPGSAQSLSSSRSDIEEILTNWNKALNSTSKTRDLTSLYNLSESNLTTVRNFLSQLALAINSLTADDISGQTTIAGFKTSVSSARTEISTADSKLLAAKTALNNAPSSSGGSGDSNFDDVRAEAARVESLRANVSSIQSDLAKMVLKSPISGIVTKSDAKVGEIVTSGASLVSVISDKKLEIEANVSEVNIGKVKVGNNVSITFDAFPGETFQGTLSYIDPGETLIDGVPTYKITVTFSGDINAEIRSGLTANLVIETAKKDNVIKIPRYAIKKVGDKTFVTVRVGDKNKDREITTGLIGKDGTIEVLTGLQEGENIVAEVAGK